MSVTREELIAVVQQSPDAVAIHDKAAWMGIFANNHVVEDPVGSTPHLANPGSDQPHDALSRFYDTFIAPNTIAFDVEKDTVCAKHVMRNLTINLQMSDKVEAQVPMHLLYELAEEDGCYKVARLAAHWEFMPMIMQLLKKGFAAVPVLCSLTVRMFKHQGLSGTLGFSKAAINIGAKGKQQVLAFERAVASDDGIALKRLFESDQACIHFPFGQEPVNAEQLLASFSGSIAVSKLLVSGDTVTATVKVHDKQSDSRQDGVAIFKFNRKTLKMNEVFVYVD